MSAHSTLSFDHVCAQVEAWAKSQEAKNLGMELIAEVKTPQHSYCWDDARLQLSPTWVFDSRHKRVFGVVQFTDASQGGPKTTHGGAVQLVMDVASHIVRQILVEPPLFRSNITVRYLNLTPIGHPLLIEAFKDRARILTPEMKSILRSSKNANARVFAESTYSFQTATAAAPKNLVHAASQSKIYSSFAWPESSLVQSACDFASRNGRLKPDELLPRIGEYEKFEFPPDASGGAKILVRCFCQDNPVRSHAVFLFGPGCGPDWANSHEYLNGSAIYVALDQLAGRATRLSFGNGLGRPVTAEMHVGLENPEHVALPAVCTAEVEVETKTSSSGKLVILAKYILHTWPARIKIAAGHARFAKVEWESEPQV